MDFKTIYNLQNDINNGKSKLETSESLINIPNKEGILLITTSENNMPSISKVIIF